MAACAFRGGGAPARPLFSAPTHQKDQGITEGAVPMPLDSKKPAFDKSKLPSRYVSVGPQSAPHRSYYYAMGMTEEEIAQPFVGVATCRSEEHTSELQSLMRISYAVFCLKKKKNKDSTHYKQQQLHT